MQASSRIAAAPAFAAGLALLALAAGLVAWRFAGLATDDIYITYRYAQNLAAGEGFAFNPGERVFGVTDPGVALLLGLVHAVTGIPIPVLGTMLTALALWGMAALIGIEAAERGRWPEGIAAGALLMVSPYLWTAQGSGPVMALALLLVAARLDGSRPIAAGVVAGFAVWCRPDAVLGVGILALLLWRERRRLPLRFALAAAAVVLAGLAAAWWAFGSVVPATLAAKRQYAALAPELRTGAAVFWGRALDHFGRCAGPLAPALLLLGLAGQVPLLRSAGRAGRLLALHGGAVAIAYTLLEVPFFLWYTVPPVTAVLVGAAWAGGSLVRATLRMGQTGSDATKAAGFRIPGAGGSDSAAGGYTQEPAGTLVRHGPASGFASEETAGQLMAEPGPRTAPITRSAGQHRPVGVLAAGVAALVLTAVATSALLASGRWYAERQAGDWRYPAYRSAGEWIRAHSRPGETVFAEEVGMIAFFSQRSVEDPIGLVSPRSLPFAAVGDMTGAFLARPTEFVVFHGFTRRGGTRPVVARPWFERSYREAVRLDLPRLGGSISVYRRLPGAVLPPARPPRARPAGAGPAGDPASSP